MVLVEIPVISENSAHSDLRLFNSEITYLIIMVSILRLYCLECQDPNVLKFVIK